MSVSNKAREDVTLLTETGYLMLDDLAWGGQRSLAGYFRHKKNDRLHTAFTFHSFQSKEQGVVWYE